MPEQPAGHDTTALEDQLGFGSQKIAPSSSIHFAAGRPKGIPHASRGARMNSAFGKGQGAATFTGPETSSRAISQSTARVKSRS